MQTEIEKLKAYMWIKWGTIALIVVIELLLLWFGAISGFVTVTVLLMLFVAALVNLCLLTAIRNNKLLFLAAHVSLVADILVIAVALYLGGGMENTWLFNPVIIIYGAGYIFSLAVSLFYATFAFVLVALMFALESFKIIPHFSAYGMPEAYWRNPQHDMDYLMAMFFCYFVAAFSSGLFNRVLTRASEHLAQSLAESKTAQQETERSRRDLQAALEQEEKTQDALRVASGKIEKTNEQLEKKSNQLEAKMVELKEFNDMAVGRELKMIELQEEIDRLLIAAGKPAKYK